MLISDWSSDVCSSDLVGGEIFAVCLGPVVAATQADVRIADPRRQRRREAAPAEADTGHEALVVGVHAETAARGVEIAPAAEGRAPDEGALTDRKSVV